MTVDADNLLSRPDAIDALRPDLVELLLRPRSVAIIGISRRPGSAGAGALAILKANRYPGDLHLVGRGGGTLDDHVVLESIADLPEGVELGIFAVPASGVVEALEACIQRRMRTAVIFASGFAEVGDGDSQGRITALAQSGDIGIVGPNCMGYADLGQGFSVGFMGGSALQRTPADRLPGVAILAQSGGLMSSLSAGLIARAVPVTYRISSGNEAGLSLPDYLAHAAADPRVGTIVLYAEHVRRPAAFLEAARQARANGKPMVMLHTGRGEKAQKAAASHTGALAGEYQSMAAAIRDAGVLLVDTLEELIDCTELLARFPRPLPQGPAVATTSGALCAIAHDTCEDLGLDLPPLSPGVKQALAARLPDFIVPANPLDLSTLVVNDVALIGEATAALLADPANGGVVLAVPGSGPVAVGWLEGIVDAIAGSGKPVITSLLGEDGAWTPEFEALARSCGAIITRSPERALRTMARVVDHARVRDRIARAAVVEPFENLPVLPAGTSAEWRGKALLAEIGVRTPPGGLARTAHEAVAIAREVGFPVAIKIQAAELSHKTEIGGVRLRIGSEEELEGAFDAMLATVAGHAPHARIEGVLVERMCGPGLELVVGATRDPGWGPMLMVGLGGVMVEVLKDVRFIGAGMSEQDIVAELMKLRSARLLEGYRGAPRPDVAAAARTIAAIGRLMISCPQITEIDVNPLLLLAEGEGALALDALIVVGQDR